MMRKNSDLITVILPTFRRPDKLRKTLESLRSQTFKRFRVYIYDNASSDATSEVAREYCQKDHRFSYHEHPHNIGSINNFNFGLKNIETPFFSIVSDDDFLFPSCFAELIQQPFNSKGLAVAFGEVVRVDAGGRVFSKHTDKERKTTYFQPGEALKLLITGKLPEWTGAVFNTKILDKVGFLDPESYFCDIDFLIRVLSTFPSALVHKPSACFVKHPQGLSYFPCPKDMSLGFRVILQKVDAQSQELRDPLRCLIIQWIERSYSGRVARAIERGDFALAKEYVVQGKYFLNSRKHQRFWLLAKITNLFNMTALSQQILKRCISLLFMLKFILNRGHFQGKKIVDLAAIVPDTKRSLR